MNQKERLHQEHYESIEASVLFHKFWESIEKLPEDNPLIKALERTPVYFEDLRFAFSTVHINEHFIQKKGDLHDRRTTEKTHRIA